MTGSHRTEDLPAIISTGSVPAIVNPHTGEITQLSDATNETIARWLALYRTTQEIMRDGKKAVDAEMCVRADYDATYHIDVEGVGRITVDGPLEEEVWDIPKLKEVLTAMVDGDVISSEAANKALEAVVTYKVRASGINALRKRGGFIESSINACREMHPPTRRASLKESRRTSSPVESPGE